MVPNEEGVTGRHGFAMLQLRTNEDEVGCEEYDALALRASGDGRLYSVSLRNAVPLAPNIAYQGFLARERRGWRTYELPFTSFAATRGGRLLGQPRVLDVARFSSLSIAVADDLEGPFRLEIRGSGSGRTTSRCGTGCRCPRCRARKMRVLDRRADRSRHAHRPGGRRVLQDAIVLRPALSFQRAET